MPHIALHDRHQWAVLILGAPGVGLNSVGAALGGFMTDQIGYRSSHLRPTEWLCSIDVLRYKATNPELENRYFYGYAQNFVDMAFCLVWLDVIVLHANTGELARRIVSYRDKQRIERGDLEKQREAIESLTTCQEQLLTAATLFGFARIDTTHLNVEQVADAIRLHTQRVLAG